MEIVSAEFSGKQSQEIEPRPVAVHEIINSHPVTAHTQPPFVVIYGGGGVAPAVTG